MKAIQEFLFFWFNASTHLIKTSKKYKQLGTAVRLWTLNKWNTFKEIIIVNFNNFNQGSIWLSDQKVRYNLALRQ